MILEVFVMWKICIYELKQNIYEHFPVEIDINSLKINLKIGWFFFNILIKKF